jgi:hypothetical protein
MDALFPLKTGFAEIYPQLLMVTGEIFLGTIHFITSMLQ